MPLAAESESPSSGLVAWRGRAAIALIAAAPAAVASLSLAVLLGVILGHDPLFRVEPLMVEQPIRLAPAREGKATLRVYELLARGVDANEPILYRHPVTTEGREREVGLLFVAAAEDDSDLLRLLAVRGADISKPINALAVCAAVLADKPYKLKILLDELGADPNPEPRCTAQGDGPLAAARRLRDPRVSEILLAKGARDDY